MTPGVKTASAPCSRDDPAHEFLAVGHRLEPSLGDLYADSLIPSDGILDVLVRHI
jgi:hypothetical protein